MWRGAPKGKWGIWGEEFWDGGVGVWGYDLMSLARITHLLIPERLWCKNLVVCTTGWYDRVGVSVLRFITLL